MDVKSALVLAAGLVFGSAIISSSQVWIGRGELSRRMEAAEQRQTHVEERLEKLAPAKGMPPGRWRLVGTAKFGGGSSEYPILEVLDTGDLYVAGADGKLSRMNEPKGGGKQPKANGDPKE